MGTGRPDRHLDDPHGGQREVLVDGEDIGREDTYGADSGLRQLLALRLTENEVAAAA
jgi:hypothetical protein